MTARTTEIDRTGKAKVPMAFKTCEDQNTFDPGGGHT